MSASSQSSPAAGSYSESYSSTLSTVGESLAAVIRHFGGRRVFGVGGDFAANLISALGRRLEIAPASNEMHAGFAACGRAEVGDIGFCLTTYTVGSLPCVTAAALARAERLAVVFISGAPGEQEAHPTAALHHSVLPSTEWRNEYDAALRAFGALGLRVERLQGCRDPRQPNIAGYRFMKLVAHAWLHREPVFVEVPRDIVGQLTQRFRLPSLRALAAECRQLPGAGSIATDIAARLRQCEAPLVFIDDQVKRNPPLADSIRRFCRAHRIPYATSWFAKGLYDEWDGLCLGAYNGAFSSGRARRYIEGKADYILEIGSGVLTMDTDRAFRSGTHRVESFANKTAVRSTAPREGDLLDLLRALHRRPIPRFRPDLGQPPTPAAPRRAPLDFSNIAAAMNACQRRLRAACVYLPEIGSAYFASFGLRTRRSRLGRSWLVNPWYATMGTSLPYARAVAGRIREQGWDDRVVVFTGDGGFHFQSNELVHFQREGLPVTIVLMRNNLFRLGQAGDEPVYHCCAPDFDPLKLVAAYGGRGRRCRTVGEFHDCYLDNLRRNEGISLIEIPCGTDDASQCQEIRLLNLYIRAKNGEVHARAQWADLLARPAATPA